MKQNTESLKHFENYLASKQFNDPIKNKIYEAYKQAILDDNKDIEFRWDNVEWRSFKGDLSVLEAVKEYGCYQVRLIEYIK